MSPVLRCLRNRKPSTMVFRKLDLAGFSRDAPRRRDASLSLVGDKLRPVGVGGIAAPVNTNPPRLSSTLRSRSLTTWSSSSSLRSDVSDSRNADFCRTCEAKPYGTLWRTPYPCRMPRSHCPWYVPTPKHYVLSNLHAKFSVFKNYRHDRVQALVFSALILYRSAKQLFIQRIRSRVSK